MLKEEDVQKYVESLGMLSKAFNLKFTEEFEDLIKKGFASFKLYNIMGEGFFPLIERITINKKVVNKNIRIDEVNKLKYPPAEYVKSYGRANLKNQSIFYGTFDFMTAVMEMKPGEGDLITISQWKLKNKSDTLVVCPMFLRQPTNGSSNIPLLNLYNWFIRELRRFPPLESKLYFETHQFYSDCFAREVKDNQGYILSAILADKIFNLYENGIVDAIIYPSTRVDLQTSNIAIKKNSFDEKYELSKTVEKRLLDFSENGRRYVFERLGESLKIEGNRVIWK